MLMAETDIGTELLHHISDQKWPGCTLHAFGMEFTWMSSGISAMLIVALLLVGVLLPLARRRQVVPRGAKGFVEMLVVFVRDVIARPALGDKKAYAFLPYLTTLFFFLLGLNLMGLVPLAPVLSAAGLGAYRVGGSATGVLTICGAMAALTLILILGMGLRAAALHAHHHKHWPLIVCILLSPVLWFLSLAPKVPGPVGVIMAVPLAILELNGVLIKCFVLMVRLLANMVAGHALLAILTLFAMITGINAMQNLLFSGVTVVCVVSAAAICLLELLVAVLQAYIFTFLTAVFFSLYVEPSH